MKTNDHHFSYHLKLSNNEHGLRHELQEKDCEILLPEYDLYRRIWTKKQPITQNLGGDQIPDLVYVDDSSTSSVLNDNHQYCGFK